MIYVVKNKTKIFLKNPKCMAFPYFQIWKFGILIPEQNTKPLRAELCFTLRLVFIHALERKVRQL